MPTCSSPPSSACIGKPILKALELDWRPSSVLFGGTAAAYGPRGPWSEGRPFISQSRKGIKMEDKFILLVEDNPDDEELTLRALNKRRLANKIVVVRDGQEALDYLFGMGSHTGRDVREQPEIVLLDIQLPKINGIEVLNVSASYKVERVAVQHCDTQCVFDTAII
jgi:CheY-like chemotaxis protein